MSRTFDTEVTDLIDSYKAGKLTFIELAEIFRSRTWPITKPRRQPASYLELAARAQEDPDTNVPNAFDDLQAVYFEQGLSLTEFQILRDAVLRWGWAGRLDDL